MEEELHGPLTIAELARGVGLSVMQLTRLFRIAVQKTPGAYLLELRMKRARLLIEHSSLSIGEVMAQVGLADRSHFARAFRRVHGDTPRVLRLQHRRLDRRRHG